MEKFKSIAQNNGQKVECPDCRTGVACFAMQTNNNKFRGTIGEKVYFKLYGKYFARTRPDGVAVSQEEKAVNVRLKMQAMGRLGKATKYVTPYGLVSRPKGESSTNTFVRLNYGCCSVSDGVAAIDYPQLVFAQGSMMPPVVLVSYQSEDHSLVFVPEPVVDDSPGCMADDKVYAVVLETGYNQCRLLPLGNRGDGEQQVVPLHPLWNQENLHVYVFATNAKGDDASFSSYLTVDTV